jgi:radical SAM superfamily enzyme YgiQ (UPF0313 family)
MSSCLEAGQEVDLIFYEAEDTYLGMTKKNVDYEEIVSAICRTRPDIVAFSCVTDNYQYQLQCATLLKKRRPDIHTIFGGIHPTAVPEKLLQQNAIDAVAIGEAEQSLVDLLEKSSLNGRFDFPDIPIPGVAFKKNDGVIGEFKESELPDIDRLPFPYKQPFFRSLKDSMHEYRIMASRGCPYHCSYCFNSHMLELRGKKVIRSRSVRNVIEELVWARKEFSPKYIMFVDDSFSTNKNWLREFCTAYKKEVNLPFACIANPQYINEEIGSMLADAGCINVQMGIQSLSEQMCEGVLNRRSSNKQIETAIRTLRANKIMVQVDHMLGIPGDTIENQEEGLRFYNENRPHFISVFWLTYYPKTTIVEQAVEAGILGQHEIDQIEQGRRDKALLRGGSMANPEPYYCVSFLLGWLPILPKWLVKFLIDTRTYRYLRIKNYFVSAALPRIISSIFNRNDFRGRSHIYRFVGKALPKKG